MRQTSTGLRFTAAALSALTLGALLAGCSATESSHTIAPQTVITYRTNYTGPKYALVIGKLENKSPYMRGIFSDGTDRLGTQARQILMTHLSQTNRFNLLDRSNMDILAGEAELGGRTQNIQGGQVVVTGAVTEFGRRETGTHAMGGLLGKSKKQTAYAKVSISIVDVTTSQVVYSVQGAGEVNLSNQEVLGFGSSAGYDATLADKVLNLAMIEAVNRLVEGLEAGQWKPQ
ncbi:MAG: CsgG/HfaB family protein [Phycisphaerales bacterium]|nr:CsgG/HfaB family protein [Phycisphaerales bacterium]